MEGSFWRRADESDSEINKADLVAVVEPAVTNYQAEGGRSRGLFIRRIPRVGESPSSEATSRSTPAAAMKYGNTKQFVLGLDS